jgi:hypothetical protein
MFIRPITALGARRLVAVGLAAAMPAIAVALLAVTALNARADGPGPGGGCFSTTGPVCTFKSHNAFADFGSVSDDGCIVTDAIVQSFEALSSPGRNAATTVFVAIFKNDTCGQTIPASESNVDPTTGMPVFNGTAQFGTLLDTATLVGAAPMFDIDTGSQVFTSDINVTWRGFGPTSTFIGSSHTRTPDFVLNSHTHSTSRSAEASGSITDEAAYNVVTAPTLNALLQNATIGNVVVSRS